MPNVDYEAVMIGDDFDEEVLIKSVYSLPVKDLAKFSKPEPDVLDIISVVEGALKNKKDIALIENLDSKAFVAFLERWIAESKAS